MQLITYILTYPLIWFISKLPFKLLYLFSDVCFYVVYYGIGYRKKIVRSNLNTAFPNKGEKEINQIEIKFYRHLCDMFLEMAKSLSITEKELNSRYQFTNPEVLNSFEKENKCVNLVMGHYASYEWMFSIQSYLKNPGHALYKKIANVYFDKLVRKIRGKWNTHLIASKDAIRVMKRQQQNGVVSVYGYAADQNPKKNRTQFWTPFLGHNLPFQTGAERMAIEYDIPVVFFGTQKISRGVYRGTFKVLAHKPRTMADGEITTLFVKELEKQIIDQPEYYLWTHKRFKYLGMKEKLDAKFNFSNTRKTR